MAKKSTKKVKAYDETIEFEAHHLAALIRGEVVVVNRVLLILTESDNDIASADIMTLIQEDMENHDLNQEEENREEETEQYEEDQEDQEDEENFRY